MILDTSKLAEQIRRRVKRLHNHPPSLAQQIIADEAAEEFDRATAKCAAYLHGAEIVSRPGADDPAWFNCLSLVNWSCVAQAAGVPVVPFTVLESFTAIDVLQSVGQDLTPELAEKLARCRDQLSDRDEPYVLRPDFCAPVSLKIAAQEGRAPDSPDPLDVLVDERVAEQSLVWPESDFLLLVRPWVEPQRRKGTLPDGRTAAEIACEWRVYVHDGEVKAVSNYAPFAPAALDDWERVRERVLALSWRMIVVLGMMKAFPHHPRMEQRPGLDLENLHCSFDFLETSDGEIVLLECGPGHFRDPPWGAHPCCFGVEIPPAGLALGPGSIHPDVELRPASI